MKAGQWVKAEVKMGGATLLLKEDLPKKKPHVTSTLASPAFIHPCGPSGENKALFWMDTGPSPNQEFTNT